MDTYLTIMVTVLVATQVIRIAQNTIQLHRQNKLIKKEIAHLGDVTQEDFDNQRKAYKLAIEYFERANITQGQNGLNLFSNAEKAHEQLHGYCPACKNYTPNHNEGECEECKHEYFQYQNIDARDKWEWCGIKKGDHDA